MVKYAVEQAEITRDGAIKNNRAPLKTPSKF
jgi:hypothetical protein